VLSITCGASKILVQLSRAAVINLLVSATETRGFLHGDLALVVQLSKMAVIEFFSVYAIEMTCFDIASQLSISYAAIWDGSDQKVEWATERLA
jgi:hypothetical protein